MPNFDIKVGMRFRGNYVPTDAYEPLDLVRYQGAVYLNKVACTGVLPTDTTKFDFYLSDGLNGTNGTNGTNGVDGAAGTNGTNGLGYDGVTSVTSLAVGTGSKAFTVNAVKAYAVNQRVRVSNSATNWMSGIITSISGLVITVNVDLIGGTGTLAAWSFAQTGERGATGAAGTNGTNGATITAASYNAATGILTLTTG